MKKYLSKLVRELTPADIFVFFIFSVFQLTVYWAFRKIFFIMAFLLLLIYYSVYTVVFHKDLKPLLRSLDIIDLIALMFGIALSLSCLLSQYRRFSIGLLDYQEGLIIYLFYIAAFIVLRRITQIKRRHLYLFVAIGCIVCTITIPVFFGVIDILEPPAALTTYTNVDMLSQVLVLYFAVNFLLSVRQSNRVIRAFHYAAELLFMFVAVISQCDGIIIFFAAFFIVLPFIVKIDLAVIKRVILSVSTFCFALALYNIFGRFAKEYATAFLIEFSMRIPFYITLIVGAAALTVALLIKSDTKKDFTKIFRWEIPALLAVSITVALLFWWEPLFRYYKLYGGSRIDFVSIGLWTYIKIFSPVQKLIGTGICSFNAFIPTYCPYLIPKELPVELLYPHNFVLELIFETGALGFITGGAFIVSSLINAARQKEYCQKIAFVAVLLYFITRLFYVSSPELTPIAVVFLAGCCPVLPKSLFTKQNK